MVGISDRSRPNHHSAPSKPSRIPKAEPVDGIAVPGMPAGSPGMPGEAEGPLAVSAFTDDVIDLYGRYWLWPGRSHG